MHPNKPIRLAILGSLMLTGCNLRIDGGLPFLIATPTPVTSSRPPVGPPASVRPDDPPIDPASPAIGVLACSRSRPAVEPVVGNPGHGEYVNQRLPGGWDAMRSEAEVTLAIRRIENGPEWGCFQSFYPGAVAVFRRKRDVVGPPPDFVTPPPPPPSRRPWLPPPPPCKPVATSQVAISGSVFDEQGVPFRDGVEVRVRNRDHSFSTDAFVQDGRYYVYGAPAGVKLEITAVHEGSGEARRRFVVPAVEFESCGQRGFAVVNFGGPKSADDPLGHRYPLPTVDAVVKKESAIVSGSVYDDTGAPLDGVTVTVSSLITANPYSATVTTSGGAYVVNDVPAGVPMEVRVKKEGYFARARYDVFFAGDGGRKGNIVNFGGPAMLEDPHGAQYALVSELPPEGPASLVVKGQIATIDGAPVQSAIVSVKSLHGDRPYEVTVTGDANGNYVLNDVPAGIELEITVQAAGFEPIFRIERLWSESGTDVVNFGGGSLDDDPEGEYYPLVELLEEEEE